MRQDDSILISMIQRLWSTRGMGTECSGWMMLQKWCIVQRTGTSLWGDRNKPPPRFSVAPGDCKMLVRRPQQASSRFSVAPEDWNKITPCQLNDTTSGGSLNFLWELWRNYMKRIWTMLLLMYFVSWNSFTSNQLHKYLSHKIQLSWTVLFESWPTTWRYTWPVGKSCNLIWIPSGFPG